ncbi:MAG: hypothetical protein ACK2UJ_22710 [Candidatus Promineifilaceae bacterium]
MTDNDIHQSNGVNHTIINDHSSLTNYTCVINDLNDAFHHNYSKAIQYSYESLGRRDTPTIIVSGDHVTLYFDGKQETVLIIPDLYQRVKSISHVSFGIYVTLANNGFGPLVDAVRADLTDQLDLIEKGLSILEKLDIPHEFISIQRDTLITAAEIVRDVLDKGAIEEEPLLEFGRASAPLYLDNAALAARLELDALHKVISRWQEQVGPVSWKKIYVVICAAHQARYRETTKQYFQRLFHESEGLGANFENRVIYAEHIHDNEAALQLLARHLVDQRTSIALFGQRTRLQEDLMSDGAAEYLKALFAR